MRKRKTSRESRDEAGRTFSRARLSPTGSGIALFAVRFASRFSSLLRFSLLLSRAYGPLLISRSFFRLLLSRTRARTLVIYRDYSRVDTDSTGVFPSDTVFLDISLRPTATTTMATRKCGACFSFCHVLARSNAIIENLRCKTRQPRVINDEVWKRYNSFPIYPLLILSSWAIYFIHFLPTFFSWI